MSGESWYSSSDSSSSDTSSSDTSSSSDSSSSGGSYWGDIFKAILGGIGSSAEASAKSKMSKEEIAQHGFEDRKSADFAAQLADYYKQKDQFRKRAALDTYGQFSLLHRYAPNYKPAPGVDVPPQPVNPAQ